MNKEFNEAFVEKYPESAIVLKHFQNATKALPKWENMTKTNLLAFVKHLKGIMAQNSARTYAALVKSLLNDYREEVIIPCKQYEEALKIKKVKSINTFLNEKEVLKIVRYEVKSPQERYVKNIFLIGCLTGARHSDCISFNKGNIIGKHLIYMSEKTKSRIAVPLSSLAVRLIEELPLCKSVNEANYNIAIRKICKKINLASDMKVYKAGEYIEGEKWKFISSHTARRSFATNLYLRGADLYSISKMMGHADTTVTENYICCGLREQSAKTLNFFKKFK